MSIRDRLLLWTLSHIGLLLTKSRRKSYTTFSFWSPWSSVTLGKSETHRERTYIHIYTYIHVLYEFVYVYTYFYIRICITLDSPIIITFVLRHYNSKEFYVIRTTRCFFFVCCCFFWIIVRPWLLFVIHSFIIHSQISSPCVFCKELYVYVQIRLVFK